MDNTINVLSLCTGYGGVELGLQRLGIHLRTVAYVEREGFACANLVAKMEAGALDAAPIFTDVKTFPYAEFRGCVDLLTAGYPCQPFSAAGKRQGADDPRHLWPHIARGIQLCRPGWVFCENVEGHISLGLSTVISDLEEMGYRATWNIFSAAEVGAPHQRKRVFILAHASDAGPARFGEFGGESGNQETAEGVVPSGSHVANVFSKGLEGYTGDVEGTGRQGTGPDRSASEGGLSLWPARPGEPQHFWEEPRVVGDAQRHGWGESITGRKAEGRAPTGGSGEALRELADTSSQRRQQKPRGAYRDEGANGRQPDGNHFAQCESESGEFQLGHTANAGFSGSGPCKTPKPTENKELKRPSLPEERQTQPRLGGAVNGPASRVDRLRLLGNGVVPATAAKAFATLYEELSGGVQ